MPITEENYPIRGAYFGKLWVSFFISLIIGGVLVLIGIQPAVQAMVLCNKGNCNQGGMSYVLYAFTIFFVIFAFYFLIHAVSMKVNFHYALDDSNISVKKGLFSRQEQYMPYETIQNVWIVQGPLDKMFGIASLRARNAAAASAAATGAAKQTMWSGPSRRDREQEAATVWNNTIDIPGLARQDAETLRDAVLQKMQQNPPADTGAGL